MYVEITIEQNLKGGFAQNVKIKLLKTECQSCFFLFIQLKWMANTWSPSIVNSNELGLEQHEGK